MGKDLSMVWELFLYISSPKGTVPLHTRACVIPRLPRIIANEVIKDKGLQ